MFVKPLAGIWSSNPQRNKVATLPIAFTSNTSLLKNSAVEIDTFVGSKISSELPEYELIAKLIDLAKSIEIRAKEYGVSTFESSPNKIEKIESITENGVLLQKNFFSGRLDVKRKTDTSKLDVSQTPYDIKTKTHVFMPNSENVVLERFYSGFCDIDYGIDFDRRNYINRFFNPETKEILQEIEYTYDDKIVSVKNRNQMRETKKIFQNID